MGSLEGLHKTLAGRVEARRAGARQAWKESGPAWLASPGEKTAAPLRAWAPEIQEPLLDALEAAPDPSGGHPANKTAGTEAADPRAALIALLAQTMNPAGGDRLAGLLASLPDPLLPSGLEAAAGRGSLRALEVAGRLLAQGSPAAREASLEVLLAHADPGTAPRWLEAVSDVNLSGEALGRALERLADRELPATLLLPETLFQREEPAVLTGLARILRKVPDPDREDFLLDHVLAPALEVSVRQPALEALEASATAFHWRRPLRLLEEFLRDHPRDSLAEPLAWTLHRLGSLRGTRFLLEGPLAKVKRKPKDGEARLALGRLQVELGQFPEAYRELKKGFDLLAGQRKAWLKITSETWFFAARAAAGARHYRESGDWLRRSGMTPQDLEPYRNLPEFHAVLNRQPFKDLFGIS